MKDSGAEALKEKEVAEKQARALELRTMGWHFTDIATELGLVDRSHARKYYMRAIKSITREPANHALTLELERLDKLMKVAMTAAENGDLEGVRAALKVSERRSAFLGLDAPKKQVIAAVVSIDDMSPDQLEERRQKILALLKKDEPAALLANDDDDDE